MKVNAPLVLFVLSCMFWSFLYGYAVHRFHWFPYRMLEAGKESAVELADKLTGKMSWYYRPTDRTEPVIDHRPSAFAGGLTLVGGLNGEGNIEVKVIMRNGEVLHRWLVDWFDGFWPDPYHLPEEMVPRRRPATHPHGMALLPNGDLVFNLEDVGLVRLGLCGNVIWQLPYNTHHAVDVDEAGYIWVLGLKQSKKRNPDLPGYVPTFNDYTVLKLTPDGRIEREISVFDVLQANELPGLLYMSATDNWSAQVKGDTLHANDVEIFPSSLTPGVFSSGDIMISLRNIHTVLVFDQATLRIKYLSTGAFVRQHDPDFIDGNRISVFDNNNVEPESQSRGPQSRIVMLNAASGRSHVVYSGSKTQPFFTDIMGKHQWLANGNILITESTKGRAFEIDPEGELVWEYFNIVDEGRLGLLDEAQRLPPFFTRSFFEEGVQSCERERSH